MSETFLTWDLAQVSHFLGQHLDADLSHAFIENDIDGALLPFLTTEHLRELGIGNLGLRLRAKKAINELLLSSFSSGTMDDGDIRLSSININSNYVTIEALTLCQRLLKDLNVQTTPRESPEVLKLSELLSKLKADLNPVIRLAKEAKPLPVPTLDPGVLSSLPTQSIGSTVSWAETVNPAPSDTAQTTLTTPAVSTASSSSSTAAGNRVNLPLSGSSATLTFPKLASNSALQRNRSNSSPRESHRFSSGSVLSMGVGKVADVKNLARTRFPSQPRLVDATRLPSDDHLEKSKLRNGAPTLTSATAAMAASTQPLKQLKASSDDTCLKVLQLAMKSHHISRENWSKYVLVVCYADRERILKLTERPVVVFKELQEHGRNPTIMLRELAQTASLQHEYEDARLGDDIPGGTL